MLTLTFERKKDQIQKTGIHVFSHHIDGVITWGLNTRVSNSLDPDQVQHFVQPDLGPNCLQRLSADDTSKQGVKEGVVFGKVNYMHVFD